MAVIVSLLVFVGIRVKHSPKRENRRSRFFGSHTGAAWLVLLMIFGVIASLLLYRAAQVNTGNFPYGWWAFASHGLANVLKPLGEGVNSVIETVALLANIAIITGFLVFVSYSKHLHIFLAPINVATSRRPRALGALASTPGHVHGGRRRRGRGGLRGRPHRGLLVEAAPRHGHLYRVRALPVPVPGLEHRQAALPQAADHGPAGQPLLLGRAGHGEEPRRRGRGGEPGPLGHRSRCAVVLHHLRGLRRAVPGGHRAHRHHHRYAPLRGADGVRSSRPRPGSCSATWRTRATHGGWARPSAPTGPTGSTSRCR